MKYLIAVALTILSFTVSATQIVDAGTGFNPLKEINGATLEGQSAGTLTTTYSFPTPSTQKRQLTVYGLRCAYCVSNAVISNNLLKITGDALGTKSQYISTAITYTGVAWADDTFTGLKITSNATLFTEMVNNSPTNAPGAKVRMLIYTTTGTITTTFYDYNAYGETIMDAAMSIPTDTITKITVEFYNVIKLTTGYTIETLYSQTTPPTECN